MIKSFAKQNPPLAAFVAFCSTFLCSLPFNKFIFAKYITEPAVKFDHSFYMTIAKNGYQSLGETAFYPLWPIIMGSVISVFPESLEIQAGNLLSLVAFGGSLVLIYHLTRDLFGDDAGTWAVFLFALNPNSIFHALAYPESFFSLLTAIFLTLSARYFRNPSALLGLTIFLSAAAMGATRPIILQFVSAALCAVLLTAYLYNREPENSTQLRLGFIWLGLSTLGMVLSYIPYGLLCLEKFQDFFAPFNAQKLWDRKFGFYWSLLTNPKSVSSSDNVLTWDIQAFYLPVILLGTFLFFYKPRHLSSPSLQPSRTNRRASVLIILFCLFVAAAHSAIAFLTYPIFMSLGRHVFATPFFFIGAIGVMYAGAPTKWRLPILKFYLFASALYLIHFWTRFGKSSWMG